MCPSMVIGPQAAKPLSGSAVTPPAAPTPGSASSRGHNSRYVRYDARTIRVPAAGHRQLEGEHAVGIEAGFDIPQFRDAPREQAGPGDEDHGERQLGDHEGPAQAMAAPPQRAGRRAPASGPQRLHGIGALCAGERSEPEQHARQHGQDKREQQHATVHGHGVDARQVIGLDRTQPDDARVRQGDAHDTTGAGEQEALTQDFTRQSSASGTERNPDGELAAAGHRARELEVGDVRARDEQHQQDGAGQHEERTPHVANHLIEQWHRSEGEAAVGRVDFREIAPEPRRQHVELGLGGFEGHAGAEPGQQVVVLGSPHRGSGRRQRQRQEYLGVLDHAQRRQHLAWERESRRQHPDDLVRLAVQNEGRANRGRVAAEPPLPQPVREHECPGPARDIVLGHEQAAGCRATAEHRQQVGRDSQRADAFRLAAAGDRGVGADGNGHIREGGLTVANVEVLGRREPVLGDAETGRSVPQHHQAFGFRIGQGPQEHAGGHAEEGGVGADAERQRHDGRGGKSGALAEEARRGGEEPHGDIIR